MRREQEAPFTFYTLTISLFLFTTDDCIVVSAKNLGRLRKRTAAAGGAATSELHEDEVQAAEVMPSNGEGMSVGRNTHISFELFC